jgi:hypothetical protein
MLSVCDWARFMKLLCAHQSQYVRVSLVLRCQFAFEEAALYNIGRFMVRCMPAIRIFLREEICLQYFLKRRPRQTI